MRKSETNWSVAAFISLMLTLWLAFLTDRCRADMSAAQTSDPPPPPDDYVGALVLMLLGAAAVSFGLLFAVSLLVLLVKLARRKFGSAPAAED